MDNTLCYSEAVDGCVSMQVGAEETLQSDCR